MRFKERGFTLVEVIIVMAVISSMTAVVAPKAIEAQKKVESNALRDEFNTLASLNTVTHGIRLDMKDRHNNYIMKEVVVPVAPSAAFGTILRHEPFRRLVNPVGGGSVNESRPLVLSYDQNQITAYSPVSNRGNIRHLGDLTVSADFNGGITKARVQASGLSSQGGTGISPIFSLNETKLHRDFVLSQSGLDFAEFDKQFTGTYADILAGVFGGPAKHITMSYYPYEPTDNTEKYLVKAPIELTIVDTQKIETSSTGASVSRLTDESIGALYQVTGMMSRAEFVSYVAGKPSIFGTADAHKMYDKLDDGFDTGEVVFVPHRARDIIYSTKSDLKFGYYRD